MSAVTLRVRAIIKSENKYLVVKHWTDDRIPYPYRWEFVDTVVQTGEDPNDAVLRGIQEELGVEGIKERIVYVWSKEIGETQCVGIVYLCSIDEENLFLSEEYGEWKWIDREEFSNYIDNQLILDDLKGVAL